MASLACQVFVQPERIGFVWSEGPAAFEPYYLTGSQASAFHQALATGKAQLQEFAHAPDRAGAAFVLAQAGHELHQQMFAPEAAGEVRAWLTSHGDAVPSLEIIGDGAELLPWTIVYDRKPEAGQFGKGGTGWQAFWGLRYPLIMGRRVNPLRRLRVLEKPVVALAIDPALSEGISAADREKLQQLLSAHNMLAIESRERLVGELKAMPVDVFFFVGHGGPEGLRLGGDTLTAADLRAALEGPEDAGHPLVVATIAGEGQPGLPAGLGLLSGLITNLAPLPELQAWQAGMELLSKFLYGNASLASLKQQDPSLGLLYATSLTPNARVSWKEDEEAAEEPEEELTLPPAPYRPLAPYEREDALLFHGRETDTERVAGLLDEPEARVLLLHGQSGVGKASLVRAGVLPYLEQEALGYLALRDRSDAEEEAPVALRATSDLLGQLALGLAAFCARPFTYETPTGREVVVDLPGILAAHIGRPVTVPTASDAVSRAPQPANPPPVPEEELDTEPLRQALRSDISFLGRLLNALTERLPFDLVLPIEQGEELFSLTPKNWEGQKPVPSLDALRQAAHQGPRVRFLISLRTEYYGRILHHLQPEDSQTPWLRDYLLAGLSEQRLTEAILLPTAREPLGSAEEVPFTRYGFQFEEGIPERIAAEAMAAGREGESALALVQVVCARLAARAKGRADRVIRGSDLTAIGGVKGALSNYVDQLFQSQGLGRDRSSFDALLKPLLVRQPDGTVTRDLVLEDRLAAEWRGATAFGSVVQTLSQPDAPLFEVDYLNLAGKEGTYVSLGHDVLAPVLASRLEESERKSYARTRMVDVLWITIPLIVLAGVLGWTGHSWLGAAREAKGDELEELRQQAKTVLGALQVEAKATLWPVYVGNLQLARQALEAGDSVRFRQLMLSHQTMMKEDDQRGFEWYHLWRQGNQERKTLLGHRSPVVAVALSADGKRAATASQDGTARLWDVEKIQENAVLPLDAGMVLAAAFSPDGKLLATGHSNGKVAVWNAAEGEKEPTLKAMPLAVLAECKEPIHAVAFLDATTLAAAGEDKAIRLWDVSERGKEKVKQTLSTHSGAVNALRLSPDGKTLASGSADQTVLLWDIAALKDKPAATFKVAGPASALAFTADGKTLAVAAVEGKLAPTRGVVTLWNVADGKEKQTLKRLASAPLALAFRPDGKTLVVGGKDNSIHLLDVASGNERAVLRGHLGWVSGLAITPDGKTIVTGSYDSTVRIWWGETLNSPEVLTGHKDAITSVALTNDDKLVASGSADGTVKLWLAATGEEQKTLTAHKGPVLAVAFANLKSPILASAGADGTVQLWNADLASKDLGKNLGVLQKHSGEVTCLSFARDGKTLASGGGDATVRLWSIDPAAKEVGSEAFVLRGHEGAVWCLTFRPKEGFFSGGADGTIRMWDPKDGKAVGASAAAHAGGVLSLGSFGREGPYLLSGGADHLAKIWVVERGRIGSNLAIRGHGGPVTGLAMGRNDFSTIVTAGGDGIKLWRPNHFNYEAMTLPGAIRAVAMSADRTLLVSGDQDGTVRLWRAPLAVSAEK